MTAYDWLKANPRENAPIIMSDWQLLMTDTTVPNLVRKELVELASKTNIINDSILYWHGKWYLNLLCCATKNEMEQLKKRYSRIWTKEVWWLQVLYEAGVCAGNEEIADKLWESLEEYTPDRTVSLLQLQTVPNRVWEGYLEYMHNHYKYNRTIPYSTVMRTILIHLRKGVDSSFGDWGAMSSDDIIMLLTKMNLTWLIRTERQLAFNTCELLRDIPDEPGKIYSSYKEVENIHEKITEEDIKQRILSNPIEYEYDPWYEMLVKDHGFKLPKSRAHYIERGMRHHNCVATYEEKTTAWYDDVEDGEYSFSRMLFAPNATCEILFIVRHRKIVTVNVIQYKGAYNKDVHRDELLSLLQIDLVGKPASILSIKKHNTKEVENVYQDEAV